MSGGVGPTYSDICLTKPGSGMEKDTVAPVAPSLVESVGILRSFGFAFLWQLNALAIALVFAATGMVSVEDFAFSLFSLIYIFFIAKVVFPATSTTPSAGDKTRTEQLLSIIGAVLGLVLPVVYVFEGLMEGDRKGVAAAAPHVFLLASRMFMDGLADNRDYSPPVKAFVQVLFNVKLLFTISDWVREEVAKKVVTSPGSEWSVRRLYAGRALAGANMGYWSLYLFGFLLPVCLPRAFKKYYGKVKE